MTNDWRVVRSYEDVPTLIEDLTIEEIRNLTLRLRLELVDRMKKGKR